MNKVDAPLDSATNPSDTPQTDALIDAHNARTLQDECLGRPSPPSLEEHARNLERTVNALAKAYIAERDALLALKERR